MKLFSGLGKTKLGSKKLINSINARQRRGDGPSLPSCPQMRAITPGWKILNYWLLNLIFGLLVFSISVLHLMETVALPVAGRAVLWLCGREWKAELGLRYVGR